VVVKQFLFFFVVDEEKEIYKWIGTWWLDVFSHLNQTNNGVMLEKGESIVIFSPIKA